MSEIVGFLQGALVIGVALAFLFFVTSLGSSLKRYLREAGWFYVVPWSRWVREMRQSNRKSPSPPDSDEQ